MYYKMYPAMYCGEPFPFCFQYQWQEDILTNKYETIKDAISFARMTGICLREINWYIYKCSWFRCVRISLKSLYDDGLLSSTINKDEIGEYYNWKD